jgi:4-methyl-5(b-hydroxyethyl)-thiazole monophosphate biosynthesis
MKKCLVLFHPGVEEIEAVTPVDLRRRAGVEVEVWSTEQEIWVTGGRSIALAADLAWPHKSRQQSAPLEFDALVLPGGPGVGALRLRRDVLSLIRSFAQAGKIVTAQCAAPLLLMDAGLTAEVTLTSFPGEEASLAAQVGRYSTARVVEDGLFLTARGAGTAEEFSLALISKLCGQAQAQDIAQRIVARG